jgi:hypothetical protein
VRKITQHNQGRRMKIKCIGLLVVAALLSIGCDSAPKAAPIARAAVAEASNGTVAIKAHTESAGRAVEAIRPHVADEPAAVALVDVAQAEHVETLKAAEEVATSLAKADDAITLGASELAKVQGDLAALKARWFVRWGLWIERILWIIVISWAALGAASIFLGIGNPIGWPFIISREIVRLLPFANFYAWLRDGGIAIRTALSKPKPVPTPAPTPAAGA